MPRPSRISPTSLVLVLVLSALAWPAARGARADASPPEAVALSFDWPVGTHLKVQVTAFRLTATAAQRKGSFDVVVEGDDEQRNVLFVPTEPPDAESPAFSLSFDEIRIDRYGDLRPDANGPEAGLVWDALVGRWKESTLEPGHTHVERAMVPVILGIPLPGLHERTLDARVPCTPEESEPRCVRLLSTVKLDEQPLRVMLSKVFGPMTGLKSPGPEAFEGVKLDARVRLVTEPDTLTPHRLELAFSLEGPVRGTGQLRHMERYTYEFTAPHESR